MVAVEPHSPSFFRALVERLPLMPRRLHKPLAHLHCAKERSFSSEKQEKLDALCEALLRKKELLASGKIQLIGLAKVRKRLGKRWKGMSELVFGIVEDVISCHLQNESDFFVKYKDSNYLLFFASTNIDQSKKKIATIAREIQERLFELDDDALRELEIKQSFQSLANDSIPNFDDFLDAFPPSSDIQPMAMNLPELDECDDLHIPQIQCVDVEAEDYIRQNNLCLSEVALPEVDVTYRAIWDVKRNALNTFVAMASPKGAAQQCLRAHALLYEQLNGLQQAAMDLQLLRLSITRIAKVVESGKRILIACPVQHQSLYNYGYYAQFIALLQNMPPEHRGYLVFYIMDIGDTLPVKDAYWFVINLKHYARFAFAEVPLRHDINFSCLRKRHLDAVGFRLGTNISQKLSVDRMMNLFHMRATAMKIPMTFVFGLSAVDDAASTAMLKYDYVCGDVIQKAQAEPQKARQFTSEDILLKLIQSGND